MKGEFIALRDTFYIASVSETGWPYVQHRGGPPGFIKVLDATTLGFADYRGNRQYVSVGNVLKDDRVALILVDYPNRTRLKILGHARIVSPDETDLLATLCVPAYVARVERGFMIKIAAYDWNCPQHITPRFAVAEIESLVGKLKERLASLEAQLHECKSAPGRSRGAHDFVTVTGAGLEATRPMASSWGAPLLLGCPSADGNW